MSTTTYTLVIETAEPFHLGWLEGAMGLPPASCGVDLLSKQGYDEGYAMAVATGFAFSSAMKEIRKLPNNPFTIERMVSPG